MGGRRAAAATKKRSSSSSMRNAGKAPYDSESNSDDDVMSDEDAYEDPPSDFDDEEIDEDEAFNEDDEERYGELFDEGEEEGDDAFEDDDDHEDEERADDDDDDDNDDDDLNALMDSDEEEEEEAKPTSRSVRRVSEEADDEARATLSSDEDDDDDEDARERVLDELVGKNRTRTEKLDVRYKPIRTETIPENPFAMPASRVSDEDANMTLADVMASLGGEAVFDKHTMKRLSKISKQKAPDVPLARQIQERLDRRAAYEETSKDVTKYQPHVKENREKRTLEFKSARDDMQRKDTLGALVADFTPKTEIELEIAKALKESGHATAKDIAHGEMLAMNHLDVEDIKARQAKLAKMRAVLFYHEQKAKRLKAIKSKAYHRHNRKGELKVIGGDEDDDAEDGAEGDTPEERREYLRAQERMLLRHKNTSRWAQRAIKKGIAHLAGTREKLQEQLRIGQQLKEKIEGARTTTTELGDESTDAEDSDDDDDGGPRDDPAAERKRLLKAKAAALKAIEDGEELEGANESLFKLPFMARAMEKRKEANKAEARALLEEIDRMDGEDDDDDDDDDLSSDSDEDEWEAMTAQAKRAADSERASTAKRARLDAGKETAEATTTLKKQKKSSSKAKPVEEISKAARNMRAKAAARVTVAKLKEDDASSDSDAEADKPTVMLDEERADGMSNQDLMRRAFENDDIEAEFEKEKLADVSAELPDVDMPKNLPGWGTWAGDQKTPKWMKDAEKKAKAEKAKALKSRRDAKLKHVVISEKFDKKAAQFNVESLPHGFASKATYEGTMRQPLGLDSNTHGMFKKMNQPKVLKATGSIIKPFKMPKHKQKKSTKGR
jgi:U3 small nucleolar RNA-associated protein 14